MRGVSPSPRGPQKKKKERKEKEGEERERGRKERSAVRIHPRASLVIPPPPEWRRDRFRWRRRRWRRPSPSLSPQRVYQPSLPPRHIIHPRKFTFSRARCCWQRLSLTLLRRRSRPLSSTRSGYVRSFLRLVRWFDSYGSGVRQFREFRRGLVLVPGQSSREKDHCADGRPLITAAVFITLSSSGFPPWTDAWRWTTTRSREPFPLPPPEGKGATKPPPAGEGVKSVHVEQVIV